MADGKRMWENERALQGVLVLWGKERKGTEAMHLYGVRIFVGSFRSKSQHIYDLLPSSLSMPKASATYGHNTLSHTPYPSSFRCT